jgi:hypothetical protein
VHLPVALVAAPLICNPMRVWLRFLSANSKDPFLQRSNISFVLADNPLECPAPCGTMGSVEAPFVQFSGATVIFIPSSESVTLI